MTEFWNIPFVRQEVSVVLLLHAVALWWSEALLRPSSLQLSETNMKLITPRDERVIYVVLQFDEEHRRDHSKAQQHRRHLEDAVGS